MFIKFNLLLLDQTENPQTLIPLTRIQSLNTSQLLNIKMTQQRSSLIIHPDSRQLSTVDSELPVLAHHQIRIEVLYSAISRDDLLFLEGKTTHDYFGVEVVGRISAVGEAVGTRKVGEVVGVFHENVNRGQFKTGFTTHLQVHEDAVIFIPTSIPLDQVASLLGSGVVAFKALLKSQKGTSIAVVGGNHLAYLTIQFAKLVFGLKVTVFAAEGTQGLEQLGADSLETLSVVNLKKFQQKFQFIVIAEPLTADVARIVQTISIRTGQVYLITPLGYHSSIVVFDLVGGGREIIGVKRGSLENYVKMLESAAFHGVHGKTEVFSWAQYNQAFQRAKEINVRSSIVLQFKN